MNINLFTTNEVQFVRVASLTLQEKMNIVWSGHAAVANIDDILFFYRAKGKEETKADLTFSDVFR